MFALALQSCDKSTWSERVLVSVGDASLSAADLAVAIPPLSSSSDSAAFADDYIRKWVTKQAIVHKALQNLSDEELSVEKAVNDYRTSLVVELYQKKLVEQKFVPNLSQKDVEDYYSSMRSNFILRDHIIKGVFAIVPESSLGNIKDFRKSLVDLDSESVFKVEQFLFNYSTNYKISVDSWIPYSSVKKYFPHNSLPDDAKTLLSKKLFEFNRDGNIYFLRVTEACSADTEAPLEYVSKDIYNILLSKKKIEFLDAVNKDIYNQAISGGLIKYYDNND